MRIQGSDDESVPKVIKSIERIDNGIDAISLQLSCEGIDGKVSSQLIILQGACFHIRLPAVGVVGFFPCSDKFELQIFVPDHGRTKRLKDRQIRSGGPKTAAHFFC